MARKQGVLMTKTMTGNLASGSIDGDTGGNVDFNDQANLGTMEVGDGVDYEQNGNSATDVKGWTKVDKHGTLSPQTQNAIDNLVKKVNKEGGTVEINIKRI